MSARPAIFRLWWRCSLCRWRVDTFGSSHTSEGDRRSLGNEVLGHLDTKHNLRVENLDAAAELFDAAGTVRPRKRHVLVER